MQIAIVLYPGLTTLDAIGPYEVLRFTGKHAQNPIIRAIIVPNLALQKLTTREPDDAMLEVAITALKTVLEGEQQDQ